MRSGGRDAERGGVHEWTPPRSIVGAGSAGADARFVSGVVTNGDVDGVALEPVGEGEPAGADRGGRPGAAGSGSEDQRRLDATDAGADIGDTDAAERPPEEPVDVDGDGGGADTGVPNPLMEAMPAPSLLTA